MREGSASQTARRVAAHRLDYDRIPAPYGDPAADLALARDVADGARVERSRMHEHLRARTAFFDATVVDALSAGMTQVVIGAAGYDGRAYRYAKAGVRWFEVDHPATQADKLERVARLGIDTRQVSFVAADFTHAPVGELLAAAGLDPGAPALFLLEGVAAYLERPVLDRILHQFRQVTVDGALLAISVSKGGASPARERLAAYVAAMGEPLRSAIAPEDARALLAARGWQVTAGRERLSAANLLLARAADPLPHPARSRPAPPPVTASLPLSALLSHALVAFTIECDNEAEHRIPHRTQDHGLAPGAAADAPWLTSLAMWANCLRHLPDEGVTVGDLRRLARTGTNLDGMRRWRYVRFSPDTGRGKRPRDDAVMVPTERGKQARDAWREVTAIVERRWRDRFGEDAVRALRAALAAVVAGLDPALPDCLPILGYGLYSHLLPSAPAAPDAPAELPLWALLSRPLLAFATEYESESVTSLAISANVLRVLTADGVPTREVPVLGGVSKESIAMAAGYLRTRGLARDEPDPSAARGKVIRLTEVGMAAKQQYRPLAGAIEADWRTRFGSSLVAALRAALEPLALGDPAPLFAGLKPYPDGWRARARSPRVLPHYPMVLHRGGYPDGS